MPRGKKKKKQKQSQNKKNQKFINNAHRNRNGRAQSKKDDILDTLAAAQNFTSSELSQHRNNNHNYNDYHNNNSNGHYNGGGRKNKKNKNKQHHNKNNNKNNNKWKQKGGRKSELNQFLDQLRPKGLGIRNARSDGNCLFRAISDQISGDENNQGRFRKEIVEYMGTNSEEFAPFYVGDYDAYLTKMSKNGIWGGNMELTAAAKAFKVDIVIHSLNAARYEILYQKGKVERTIHLSYHNERHYASVRRLDDMQSDRPSKKINLDKSHSEGLQREQQRAEIAWCHNGGNPLDIESAKDELMDLTPNEQIVVARTGCYDIYKVKNALKYNEGDIEAAVENIMVEISLMANENKEKIQEQLKKQEEEEDDDENNNGKKKKKKKKHKRKKHKNKGNKEEKKENIESKNDDKIKEEKKDNNDDEKKMDVVKDGDDEQKEVELSEKKEIEAPKSTINSTASTDDKELEERFAKLKDTENVMLIKDEVIKDPFSVNVRIYSDDKKKNDESPDIETDESKDIEVKNVKNDKKQENDVEVDLDKKNQPDIDKKEKEKYMKMYKERDERINKERVDMMKIKCIDCDFQSEILLVYIKHYRFIHLMGGKVMDDKSGDVVQCPCGHQNQSDFSFCSLCGWDLRYKLKLPLDVQEKMRKENIERKLEEKREQQPRSKRVGLGKNDKKLMHKKPVASSGMGLGRIPANKLLNTGGKAIVIHKNDNKYKYKNNVYKNNDNYKHKNNNYNKGIKLKPNANSDGKYRKYLNRYWVCKYCTFWNVKANQKCMVCSMLGVSKGNNNNNNGTKLKSKTDDAFPPLNGVKMNGNTKSKGSWANMAKSNKPKQPPKQKKKNEFGWICDQCTFENKPSQQKCEVCSNSKPKKGGKQKKKKNNDHNGWKCKCTLINDNTATRCNACDEPRDGHNNNNNNNTYYADPQYDDFDEYDLKNELDSYNNNNDYDKYKYKNKNNKHYDNDNDDHHHRDHEEKKKNNNNWVGSGKKCHCGSGKKFKKCCKKLEKHQDKSYKNKFKNPQNRGYHNDNSYHGNGYHGNGHHGNGYDNRGGRGGGDDWDIIDKLNDVIDKTEFDIANFRGRKQDKIKMVKELDKLKRQKNALYKKLESEKNNAIKAKNKQNQNQYIDDHRDNNKNRKKKGNKNQVYINNGGNNNNNRGNNGNNNGAANTVIAI